jgi:H+-translocating NAD(P) transhydrogenase subunit beta
MNLLLGEAEVPCDQGCEMDEIDGQFAQVDVMIVLGENDVVNRGL